jgi:hypothetical protein
MNKNKSICKIDLTGTKRWYLNGKLHREDGPAVEYTDGTKVWRQRGKLHRIGGPAIEYGLVPIRIWALESYQYSKKDYWRSMVRRGLCTEEEAFVEML